MLVLIIGIIVFLGAHAVPTLPSFRAVLIARLGAGPYKGLHSLASGVGFGLIIWGFGLYRSAGLVTVWTPPSWTRHAAMALMWFAFVSLSCSGPRPGRIKGLIRHPMLVGIKFWALAHLLANGDAGGMILFGSFMAFAVYDRISVKRRGDMGAASAPGFTVADAVALGLGSVLYGAMLFLHPILIGVKLLG
jgi:uncharacterized membrane protein